METVNSNSGSLLESGRSGLRSVGSLVLSLRITPPSQTHVLSALADNVDKTRNQSQKDDRVHDVLSGPLEAVGEILLDAVVFLNPDVLVNSRLSEVSAERSAHRLGGVLEQDTSTVHR